MDNSKQVFSFANLYQAYKQCRRGKRKTMNCLRFEQNLEDNLIDLQQRLVKQTWSPARYVVFQVKKPKRREIFAADFSDRVVHHLLIGHIEPLWERVFIHDSYACRQNKGTHKGVARLQSFCRKVTANNSRQAWYLQLDVKGFFTTINKPVLFALLARKIKNPRLLWLSQQIIFTSLTDNCLFRRSTIKDFLVLPPHKTLFRAPEDCGLPIGNLTSQFFANVYLDKLDQFVKHDLKAKYYLRYCDDFILLSRDKDELLNWQTRIIGLLAELKLTLNNRRKWADITTGIDFLGYIVRPGYLLNRRRVVSALKEKLNDVVYQLKPPILTANSYLLQTGSDVSPSCWSQNIYSWPWDILCKLYQWLMSYLGHFSHAASFNLIKSLWVRYPWLAEYFCWQKGQKLKFRYSPPRLFARFRPQLNFILREFKGHLVLIQVGNFWLIFNQLKAPGLDLPAKIAGNKVTWLKTKLQGADYPVAWIRETGRVGTFISERGLAERWAGRTLVDAPALGVFAAYSSSKSHILP